MYVYISRYVSACPAIFLIKHIFISGKYMAFHTILRSPAAAVVLLSFLLGGCGDSDAQQAPQGQAPAVTVETLALQSITHEEELPGRTSAFKVAEIRPQVSGVIMERSFTEGGYVTEGQQLYQIDPALYRAAYESARADLQRARANVQAVQAKERRYAELVEIDAVSRQEYDDIKASLAQARADIAVAEANVTTAKVNLDYTKVYSPIDGRIGKSSVTEGALVTANQAEVLAKVTQLDPIYVDMQQSSTELMRIRGELGEEENLPVHLLLEGGKRYPHEGTLQFSEVTVDATTGSVQLRALFPNPEGVLLPGLFVQAQVVLGEEEVLLVPQKAAIRNPDGQLNVWLLAADNTVSPVPIETVREYEDMWIVAGGVKAGDTIVTEGFQKIQPGVNVTPTGGSATQEQQNIRQAGEAAEDEGTAQGQTASGQPAAPAMPEEEADNAEAQDN